MLPLSHWPLTLQNPTHHNPLSPPNPCTRAMEVAKAHQIMARYRPIAPKPTCLPDTAPVETKFHLRSRPCRGCKRGSSPLAVLAAPTSVPAKRQRITSFPLVLPRPDPSHTGLAFGHRGRLPLIPLSSPRELSLLPEREVPVERDLLQKLQESKVIVPQPVRPVGSSISVGAISDGPDTAPGPQVSKKPEEVEEEVESELLPAVVSDSNNKVRLANSAYKEMVGQPECPWLDSMVSRGGGLSRRISGEVMLDLSGFPEALLASSKGLSCTVKIKWACNGQKSMVSSPCDVIRLYCDSKDYLFTWRFRITEASASTTISSCTA